jgi:hypothetical protein
MREPQPALLLLILEGLTLLALVGWWTTRTPLERTTQLLRILVAEQATTAPPPTLLAQTQWLVQHRVHRLQGWAELSALAGVIGVVEGTAWRRHHPFGGFGFVRLALGHVLGVGLAGAVAASLVVPVPLPEVLVAAAFAASAGVTTYLLAAGRPLAH